MANIDTNIGAKPQAAAVPYRGSAVAGVNDVQGAIDALQAAINGPIANTQLATMVQATVKGRAAASGTGTPVDLTAAQLFAIALLGDSSIFHVLGRSNAIDYNSISGEGIYWADGGGAGSTNGPGGAGQTGFILQFDPFQTTAPNLYKVQIAQNGDLLYWRYQINGTWGGWFQYLTTQADVTMAQLVQGAALSVLGVAGNATADHADIVAGSDGQVLRRSGTALGFGQIAAAAIPSGILTTAMLAAAAFSTDTALGGGSPSDTVIASQKAVKAYVDALASLVSGALVFKGAWDASVGTFPGAGVAQTGWFYKVSVAGTVNGEAFAIGDDIYAVANNASTSTYAANWLRIQGDITSAEVVAALSAGALAYAKIQNGSGLSVVGRSANSAGVNADIVGTLGQVLRIGAGPVAGFGAVDLSSSAAVANILQAASMPALTGDVTNSAGALATTISAKAVSYAKMQDVSATARLLARKTAGAGSPEECTLSDILDFIGSAAWGDILFRGTAGWRRLAAGTAGQFLKTNGAGADPAWAASGGGWGTKISKTSADTRTTTTLTNDSALSFAVAASTNYHVRGVLFVTMPTSSTGGFKMQWTGPASPTAIRYGAIGIVTDGVGNINSAVLNANAQKTAFGSVLTYDNVSNNFVEIAIEFELVLENGANVGTVQLQTAQVSASGTTTIRKGSWMEWSSF